MTPEVKVLLEVDAFAALSAVNLGQWVFAQSDVLGICWVVPLQRLQDSDLDLARITILLHRPDHLDGHFSSRFDMPRFDDFAKCPLAE